MLGLGSGAGDNNQRMIDRQTYSPQAKVCIRDTEMVWLVHGTPWYRDQILYYLVAFCVSSLVVQDHIHIVNKWRKEEKKQEEANSTLVVFLNDCHVSWSL